MGAFVTIGFHLKPKKIHTPLIHIDIFDHTFSLGRYDIIKHFSMDNQ